ncbi:hypothetical protein VTK73DRAFT_3709 [Phialemonium thermophilum]|uniref:amidase n=1 Tax=Phialemonium thermophilum TaxID=223376 RepID=A0ABR3WY58_9PEZI
MNNKSGPWQSIAEAFQARRAASFPAKWLVSEDEISAVRQSTTRVVDLINKWLSPTEIEITSLDATALAERIRASKYTALEVAIATCHRATIAHQLTNCLTEVFFNEALAEAQRLDEYFQTTGKTTGPLHGVPVSVKDHYNVKGQYTTAGYISYARNPKKTQDALIVEIMRQAGAVLYAKTNNPQCMMVLETVSNIYGRTLNPWNTKLGAGGSSGGEGALLALGGSFLGVGSDIGGSIRVPAAFNGLYGFKPSARRVPTGGWECTNTGAESIVAVAGPLGRSVDDLELFFQIVSDAQPWLKEYLLGFPWTSNMGKLPAKLTVGIMVWDEVVMPHPYITRVIKETAEKLRNAGHEVIEFQPYEHKRAWDEIILPLYFTDGGADIRQTLAAGNEPIHACAERLISDPIVRPRDVHEIWKLNIARDEYRAEYLRRWAATAERTGSGNPMDALICPVAPVQGTPHGVKTWWGYCSQWNLLDYPSSVIPAGTVLETDKYPEGYTPVNDLDQENMELYDNSMYVGMPVTVQIVGLTHQDEKVMAVTKLIDDVIRSASS